MGWHGRYRNTWNHVSNTHQVSITWKHLHKLMQHFQQWSYLYSFAINKILEIIVPFALLMVMHQYIKRYLQVQQNNHSAIYTRCIPHACVYVMWGMLHELSDNAWYWGCDYELKTSLSSKNYVFYAVRETLQMFKYPRLQLKQNWLLFCLSQVAHCNNRIDLVSPLFSRF